MYYVGVDLHKHTSWFYVIDDDGKRISSKNISNNLEILKKYFEQLPKPFTLAVEATYNWYYFVDLAREYADTVFLANSFELKAFAKRHKKTDKIDARLIATVMYKGFLPIVTIADKETRMIREVLRYRMSIVADRSKNIFRLKALLDKLGYCSTGNFTTYKKLVDIEKYELPEIYKNLALKFIDQIKYLNKQEFNISKDIELLSMQDEAIRNLMSINGISHFSASLIKTEIIDVGRFKTFNRLCAYAGLAPRVSKSANKTYVGPLNNNRRKNLQWILIETAFHYIKGYPEKKKRYEEIKKRKGSNTAKVALARDMLKMIYIVLKENRPFYSNKNNIKIQLVAASALCGV